MPSRHSRTCPVRRVRLSGTPSTTTWRCTRAQTTYTVPEAAELLGISRTTAYECVRRGEIPSLTLGRRIAITQAQLEQLLGSLPVQRDPAIADQQS